MFASSWLRHLQRHWFPRRAIHRAPVRRVRPCLEVLEDRTAPAVLTVNSTLDSSTSSNVLTLREALLVVNSGSTASLSQSQLNQINTTQPLGTNDTIVFDPSLTANGPATIDLSIDGDDTFGPSALLVSKAVSIIGPSGDNGLTLARDTTAAPDRLRLFYVASGGSLTLENLTLSGGLARGGSSEFGGGAAGLGGAVVNAGSLTLLDDTLTGNQAIGGSSGGSSQALGGGGLGGDAPANSFVGGPPNGGTGGANANGGFGGGGDDGVGGFGGGGGAIANGGFGGGGGGATGSGVGGFGGGNGEEGNPGGGGAGMGGGIFNYGGALTITNSTLTGNTAQGGSGLQGGSGFGGAIFNLNGTVTVTSSTLAGNFAIRGGGSTNGVAAGGAIYNLGDNGVATQAGPALPHTTATVSLFDSILAGSNTSDFVTNTTASGTQATNGDHNLIQTAPGNFAGTNTLTGDPSLGSLQNNGGPTPTMAITSSSPAYHTGTPISGITTDQRGDVRPTTTPSLGAFDPLVAAATTTTASDATAAFGATSVTLSATVTSNGVGVNEGTVTFLVKRGSKAIGIATTSDTVSNGQASVSYLLPASLTPGTYTIDATYNPGTDFIDSFDTTHTLTVSPASTTTTANNATATFDENAQNVMLAANVSSGAGAVNEGTVTFTVKQGSTVLGTATTSGTVSNGQASVTYILPAGTAANTYTIDAVYNPGTDFTTSEDATHTLTVNAASTTTTANIATATFNQNAQNVLLSATVTSGAGPLNEGTVTFTLKQGSTVIGTATTSDTVSNGQASVSYVLPAGTAAGQYTLDAVYNPGSDFTTSSDTTHTLTIAPAAASIQFSSVAIAPDLRSHNRSETETITVHVSSPSGTVNQGTVTFSLDGQSVSAAVDAHGDASATLSVPRKTTTTSQTITASFSGPSLLSDTVTQIALWTTFNRGLSSVDTFAADGSQSVQSFLHGQPWLDFLYTPSGQLEKVVFGSGLLNWDFSYFDELTVVTLDGVLPVEVMVNTPQGPLMVPLSS